jgi:hypothetical protein
MVVAVTTVAFPTVIVLFCPQGADISSDSRPRGYGPPAEAKSIVWRLHASLIHAEERQCASDRGAPTPLADCRQPWHVPEGVRGRRSRSRPPVKWHARRCACPSRGGSTSLGRLGPMVVGQVVLWHPSGDTFRADRDHLAPCAVPFGERALAIVGHGFVSGRDRHLASDRLAVADGSVHPTLISTRTRFRCADWSERCCSTVTVRLRPFARRIGSAHAVVRPETRASCRRRDVGRLGLLGDDQIADGRAHSEARPSLLALPGRRRGSVDGRLRGRRRHAPLVSRPFDSRLGAARDAFASQRRVKAAVD